MTTITEQIQADLAYVLSLEEAAESAFFNSKTAAPKEGRISFNLLGDSDSIWSGGVARIVTAVMPKATFPTKPRPHETLTRADGSTWIIDSLIAETSASWTVRAYTETRPG